MSQDTPQGKVLKSQTQWENLFFYQKSDVVYQMAFVFCDKYIHLFKDRTLCHMIDRMMMTFMEKLETEFITEGGIKERMYKARTGYRQAQDDRLKQLEAEHPQLVDQLEQAQAEAARWKAAYEDLKQRALNAYNRQQEEIERLKKKLEGLE